MQSNPSDIKQLIDGISTVEGGVDSGKAPSLLQTNQLAFGLNIDIRNGFIRPRAGYKKVNLTFNGNSVLEARQKSGRWQVAGYYKPDTGPELILASIGGRQFRFNVATDNSVQEITISYQTNTTVNFAPPAIGTNTTIDVASTAQASVGGGILINGKNYIVIAILSPTQLSVQNVDDDGSTNPVVAGATVVFYQPNPSNIEQAWEVQAEKWWILRDGPSVPFIYDGASSRRANYNTAVTPKEIGPGRMMAYSYGRLWGANNDTFSYRGYDLVGATSGTPAENYRDAVLKDTENTFLNGGGALSVRNFGSPNSSGPITAMRFAATLDSSLGQGPLQVFTTNTVFSVNSPVDRTVWASMENPIQTVSQINNGGLSHYSTILVNGDILCRAVDGLRSMILARREFSGWGNTPISREMNRIFDVDDQSLLKFSSAVVFNNRLMVTASPLWTEHGVIHRGFVLLDFNLISSIGQKAPPVYEGINIGLNILQIVKGTFNDVERCFVFTLNHEQEIELYEITKADKFDHQETSEDLRIRWIFETASFKFNSDGFPREKVLKKLNDLRLNIADLTGEVHFKVWFRPDNYPCWIPWKEFDECGTYQDCSSTFDQCQEIKNYKPQFRPNLHLGQPPDAFDPITKRPLRHGYTFQIRVEVTGSCEIRGLEVAAEERNSPYYGELVS